MSLAHEFPVGCRVVILWGDGQWVNKNQPFPIPGRVYHHYTDGKRMSIVRDDNMQGAGIDDTYICVPYDGSGNCSVMLENVWLSKFPAALRCGPGGGAHEHVHTTDATGDTKPATDEPTPHMPGIDHEEIDADAWKSFKDLL